MRSHKLYLVALVLTLIFPTLSMTQTGQSYLSSPRRTKKHSESSQDASKKSTTKLDVNSATKEELNALPGIGSEYAQKIIDGRPYKSKSDLTRKSVLPESTYDKIKDQITARSINVSSKPPDASSKSDASAPPKPSPAQPEHKTASRNTEPESSTNETAVAPPEKGMVWVNLETKIYHREGDRWYGKTKRGKFMTESDAQKAGYRAAEVGGSKNPGKGR